MTDTKEEKIVEILDEELNIETHTTANAMGINTDGWGETPGLGFYIGDGIYI